MKREKYFPYFFVMLEIFLGFLQLCTHFGSKKGKNFINGEVGFLPIQLIK